MEQGSNRFRLWRPRTLIDWLVIAAVVVTAIGLLLPGISRVPKSAPSSPVTSRP